MFNRMYQSLRLIVRSVRKAMRWVFYEVDLEYQCATTGLSN